MKSSPWPHVVVLLLLLSANLARAGENGPVAGQEWDQAALMEMEIEDLSKIKVATVTGASKFEQKVTEAPASISIITSDDIRKYGHRTLADILRSVRGFSVSYDRNYSYAGIRGFNRPGDYNTRLLLLVDGHRINDNVYDQAQVGSEFLLDVDLIDRIEIIRGPGSSLYGSNAFFGVINVITRSGGEVKGAELAAAAASFDTYAGRATYGLESPGGLSMMISGSAYDSKGPRRLYYPEFATPANNNGIADSRDGDRSKNAFTKISFKDFTLQGAYGHREKDVPTASFGAVFNDPANRSVDERAYLDLTYQRNYGPQASALARIYLDSYNFTEDYAIDYPPVTPNRDTARGRWWGGELRNTATYFAYHKVTAGAEYQDNRHQDQANFDLDPYSSALDVRNNSQFWALYLQDEYRLLDTVRLNLGLRHDHYSSFGSEMNPRLALIYSPFDKTTLKLLYGTAFRAPNVYEAYYADGVSSKANPGLQPEKIKTYELVYEQYLGSHVRSSLSGFLYRIDNLISAIVDPADGLQQFRNVDRSEARGAELEVEGSWANGIRGRVNYTLQKATDVTTGEVLSNSPEHLVKLNVIFPLVKEWLFVDPEVQYTSKRKTVAGSDTKAFGVANLTLFSPALVPGLDASVSVYNLFDQGYGDPGAGQPQHVQDVLEQDGRSFRLKLTYHFKPSGGS